MSEQVIVGTIGRAHGLRGTGDRPSAGPTASSSGFAAGATVRTSDRTLTVSGHSWLNGVLLVAFDGVGDRTSAEALRGLELWAEGIAEPTEPDEYADLVLIGMDVVDPDGAALGTPECGSAQPRSRLARGAHSGRRSDGALRRGTGPRGRSVEPSDRGHSDPRACSRRSTMRIDLISIFPDYFAPLELSLVGKAVSSGLVELGVHDLRTWTHDRHRTVDDTPYGGGAGMVMMPQPWGEALDELVPPEAQPTLILPTPSGQLFTQSLAAELAEQDWLLFGCGRYEGSTPGWPSMAATRMRVIEVSLGDYVLNGGEVAALAIVEAVVRLLPACSVTPSRWPRSPTVLTWTACWSTRCTPSLPSGVVLRCRRCCCPGITSRWPRGAPSSLGSGRRSGVRISYRAPIKQHTGY